MSLFAGPRWRKAPNGNYWRHVEDGDGVTVFWNGYHGAWRWVYQSEYDEDDYECAEDAMAAAEGALDL